MEIRPLRYKTIHQYGFSFIELAIILAIIASIIAIVNPSFTRALELQKARNASSQLTSALRYARQEAISRNKPVIICASADAQTCSNTSSDWQRGWLVFADFNKNNSVDTGEVIKVEQVEPGPTTPLITVNRSSAVSIAYEANGRAKSGVSNLTFSIATVDGSATWRVLVSRMGNPRMERS